MSIMPVSNKTGTLHLFWIAICPFVTSLQVVHLVIFVVMRYFSVMGGRWDPCLNGVSLANGCGVTAISIDLALFLSISIALAILIFQNDHWFNSRIDQKYRWTGRSLDLLNELIIMRDAMSVWTLFHTIFYSLEDSRVDMVISRFHGCLSTVLVLRSAWWTIEWRVICGQMPLVLIWILSMIYSTTIRECSWLLSIWFSFLSL